MSVDEMKIISSYDKYSGHIIGYTSLDDLSTILSHLEQGCEEGKDLCSAVDNHVLVLMVSGIFSTWNFLMPTLEQTADFIFPISSFNLVKTVN